MSLTPEEFENEPAWTRSPPRLFQIVTGFFPEMSPKENWATNPRPLLVGGIGQDPSTGMYLCRIAYGTTNLKKRHADELIIGNLAILNEVGLKRATRFVILPGTQMVIMPWISEFFQPWSGQASPVVGTLPHDMQRYVGHILSEQKDLPQF